MSARVKKFPEKSPDKKAEIIHKELKHVLDAHVGKENYSAYIRIVSTDTLSGLAERDRANFSVYNFAFTPTTEKEEDADALSKQLLDNISKDPVIGNYVAKEYAAKMVDFITSLTLNEEEDD